MEVLIIEDDDLKAKQLVKFVNEYFEEANLKICSSYQSGLSSAVKKYFDLILLDMNLPNYDTPVFDDGDQALLFAGKIILKELQRLDVNTQVIVVTQFEQFGEGDDITTLDELTESLEKEFSTSFRGTVYYHPAHEDWKITLLNIMQNLEW